MRYNKEYQKQRTARLLEFLTQQRLLYYQLRPDTESSRKFAVSLRNDLAIINLSYTGRVTITARNGKLKALLLSWAHQETSRFSESTLASDFAELDSYLYLLEGVLAMSPTPQSSAPLILLPPDNPLVQLAQQLGYHAYLSYPASERTQDKPWYHIVGPQGQVSDGESLVGTLAHLIKQERTWKGNDARECEE